MENERDLCAPLLRPGTTTPNLIDRVGATSITTLMATIQRAALVVCNDSAAMHMAVALARPLVALFGPTDVSHAGPYNRPQDVISHKEPSETVRHRDVQAATQFMARITTTQVIGMCEARLAGGKQVGGVVQS
jgi:heptosyltransferase-1